MTSIAHKHKTLERNVSLLGLFAFPFLNLAIGDAARRRRMARRLVQRSFHLHIEFMRALGVLTYEVRGRERLAREGLLILANHPTLIDVVFLISLIPHADCIVKAGLLRNPFTRGPIQAAGFICNSGGAELVDDCMRSLSAGHNLIIFPEGTRTPLAGPVRLQRGAAHVAVKGRVDITPVHIHTSLPMLRKGVPWWQVPTQKPHFIFEVREDIDIQEFCVAAGSESLAARQVTDYLSEQLFRGPSRASA